MVDTERHVEEVLADFARAFNRGDVEALEALLHPDVVYEAVLHGYRVEGREAVTEMFRQGIARFGGRSRMSLATMRRHPGLLWWEPAEGGLVRRGFQRHELEGGLVRRIRDSHDPNVVREAAGLPPPTE